MCFAILQDGRKSDTRLPKDIFKAIVPSKRREILARNGDCACHCRRDAIDLNLIKRCAACKGAGFEYSKVDLNAATCTNRGGYTSRARTSKSVLSLM